MTTETIDPTEPTRETPTPDSTAEMPAADAAESSAPELDAPATPATEAAPETAPEKPHVKTFGEIAETRMARLVALREAAVQAGERYEKAKAYAKAAKEEWDEERAVFEKEFDDVVRLMKGDVDLPLFQSLNAPAVPKAIADLIALLRSVDYAIDPIVASSFTLDDQSQIRTWAKREAERRKLVAEGKTDEAATLIVPPMPKVLRREETEAPVTGEVVTGPFADRRASDADVPAVEDVAATAPDARDLFQRLLDDVVLSGDRPLTVEDIEAWAPEDRVRVARWMVGGPNEVEPPAVLAPFLAPLDDEGANDADGCEDDGL
jgi:hypothetical protein